MIDPNETKRGFNLKTHDTGMIAAVKWGGAFTVAIWAGFPVTIRIMVLFMGMDMLTGVIAAAVSGKLSSSVSLRGLLKKIAMCVAVLFVHLLDGILPGMVGIGIGDLGLEKIFAVYLAFNEAISIIENLVTSGVSFPSIIIEMLVKVKGNMPQAATQQEMDALSGTSKKISVSESSEIVKTEGSSPDLKVEKTVTTLEEKRVTPISPESK